MSRKDQTINEKDQKKFNFTMRGIEALPVPKRKRATYYDVMTTGLGILLQPGSDHRAFFWFRRVQGRPTWKTIGPFPDLTVDQARTKAAEWNSLLGRWKADNYQGPNPLESPRGELTLGALFEDYLARHVKQRALRPEKAEQYARWQFGKYLARWRERKLSTIRRTDVMDLKAELAEQSGQVSSNRVLQLLRAVFNFGIDTELWDGENPAARPKLFPEQERERFIEADEMPRLFAALKTEPNPDVVDYVNLSLWTGARKSDVLSMAWKDIALADNKWTVPLPKSGTPYAIPLTPEARSIIEKRQKRNGDSPWVFPSPTSKSGHIVSLKGRWNALVKRAGISNLRQHDLRRTLGSWQAAGGASLPIIGKSLGHKSVAATAIYSRLDLDPVRKSVKAATKAMILASKQRKSKLLGVGRG